VSLLAEATSPEVGKRVLAVVPIGSLEQHGPHLPLDTDTVIAQAVARAVADRLGGWCAPALAYGSSGEHQAFPGTTSIGTPTLGRVVVELVRSLRNWAGRVLLVNGHGGNVEAVQAAVDVLVSEGHNVTVAWCTTAGMDAHAGRAETSLMLHLRPESVRLELAEPGNTASITELLPYLRRDGVKAVSLNGVLGDPRGATAEEGARLLDEIVDRAIR
jgi:mycofactocin system creatininase family protein